MKSGYMNDNHNLRGFPLNGRQIIVQTSGHAIAPGAVLAY